MAKSTADIIAEVNGMVGEGTIGRATEERFFGPKISAGSLILDEMLMGGYRLGRIYQFYGQPGAGKTYLCYLAMASAQRYAREQGTDKKVAFIDAEGSWDPEFAEKCGVDVGDEACLVSRPEYGDTALDVIEILLRTKEFQCIGCDSVAALLPKRELEKRIEDKTMGELAQMMSRGMRKVTPQLHDCMLIFINQVREKLGVMFGNPMTTPGGKALGFYSSLNLELAKGSLDKQDRPKWDPGKGEWDNETRIVGHEIKVKSVKDKTGSMTGRTCSLWFKYDTDPPGIQEWDELWILGQMYGIIKKSGRTYESELLDFKVVGKENAANEIKDHPDRWPVLHQEIRKYLIGHISDEKPDVESEHAVE